MTSNDFSSFSLVTRHHQDAALLYMACNSVCFTKSVEMIPTSTTMNRPMVANTVMASQLFSLLKVEVGYGSRSSILFIPHKIQIVEHEDPCETFMVAKIREKKWQLMIFLRCDKACLISTLVLVELIPNLLMMDMMTNRCMVQVGHYSQSRIHDRGTLMIH